MCANNMQKKKIQLVLWDNAFQDELMFRIRQEHTEPHEAKEWLELIDEVCKNHFPEADEFKLVFPHQ